VVFPRIPVELRSTAPAQVPERAGSGCAAGYTSPPQESPHSSLQDPRASLPPLGAISKAPEPRRAASPPPAVSCQKSPFSLKRQSAALSERSPSLCSPKQSQHKAVQPLFQAVSRQTSNTFSHTDTVTRGLCHAARKPLFSCARKKGFASFQGLLSW